MRKVKVGAATIGGSELVLMAGPCSAENEAQVLACAEMASAFGATILRGGAWKPRTSPHSFQGLGEIGLHMLRAAADKFGLALVTEVMDVDKIDLIACYADMLQVGARNMQNFALLRELGQIRKPILLKRGISATTEEWLNAAEYIFSGGNDQIVLCERGIRSGATTDCRFALDVGAIPTVRARSELPVIVDPSHAAGRHDFVIPLALAGIAAGADGLIVEVHPRRNDALCDGNQALDARQLSELSLKMRALGQSLGREFLGTVEEALPLERAISG